jgi:hypothetical protein
MAISPPSAAHRGLGLQPGAACGGEAVGQRGAAAAGQRVQAAARHGDGLAGRQQHLRLVPVKGDQAHLRRGTGGGSLSPRPAAAHCTV